MKFAISLLLTCSSLSLALAAPKRESPIISTSKNDHLVYDPDAHGNRVPDFSTCGYAGGDKDIPTAPVRAVISPVKGDETARIQQAIDYISALSPDSNGIRGAVLLLKGRHEILCGLQITNSGVVLRGQGMDENGTILVAAGLDRRTLITIHGRNDRAAQSNNNWQITGDYLPVGAQRFSVKDAAALKPGDPVTITRPCTKKWIAALDATEFGGGESGGWKPGTRDLVWDRVITALDGNIVSIDAPITTAIESDFGGGELKTYSWPGRISNVGVENLRLESTFDPRNSADENHSWFALTMENAQDAWVRQVTFQHFAGSAVAIYETCKRTTVEDCLSLDPVSENGGSRRRTFFTMGQQTLFLRCFSEHGRHDFSVGFCAAGPNAFVQCEAGEALDDSGGIDSWSSGTLFDDVRIDGNALTLGYRPGNEGAIGWAAANSVLWNCSASVIRCWNPPEAQNWSFGSWGSFEGDGLWRNSNGFMKPESLYVAQLAQRTGRRVQIMSRVTKESSNPTVEDAARLIAASRKPAPQLSDYIANAAKQQSQRWIESPPRERSPNAPLNRSADIPVRSNVTNQQARFYSNTAANANPEHILNVTNQQARFYSNTVSASPSPIGWERAGVRVGFMGTRSVNSNQSERLKPIAHHPISINSNGWLVCDAKLVTGGAMELTWWRGSTHPGEAPTFGPALTRFVPGRNGPGFTDDIHELADMMAQRGDVALDHHYGLWYDLRRDDHERVRRMTGDVLAPFFEQPFARTGQGRAWDGLSKYDLTKFNPWYWSRLKKFANLADERGLVLFNENYFQHNIIEAGAHWVDCPWRTANNINHTGFPEPPPFAGDKRIFMAGQFYDVTQSVRRALHRQFIRQNLDNFKGNANVIQFTSAEFSGPLPFVQFWLDTIREWEKQHKHNKPIIALAAPKNVQDAILADAKRASIVDVIVFRYWWRTDKGLYAPPGGENLSPRQFQRQWHGGAPSDINLAEMAAEYRAKFPSKPVIAAGEQGLTLSHGAWAYVCAGGSMPNLPRTTDATLLAAIPQMRPWPEASKDGRWVLREPGRQYLIYSSGNGSTPFDLPANEGRYLLRKVNARTGEFDPQSEIVQAGSKLSLLQGVVWLTKTP